MLTPNEATLKLTQTVQKGGCAAKVAANELRRILKQVHFPTAHPALLIDGGLFDDAAIYKITEEIALVQTLDFFTPILDTAKYFGAVAAANSLSDVYAMGGKPKTAMGILAFPVATMSEGIIVDILQAASDKIAEAGANFVGGHSIDDDTLKFGLSVTGFVNPKKVWSNAGAKPGDHLILTKQLGTGTLTAALKRQALTEVEIFDAIESMSQLNNCIDFLTDEMIESIHAATDITGFGFSGHSMQLALASEVSLKIKMKALPVFSRTRSCLEQGFLTKAHVSNQNYTEDKIQTSSLDPISKLIIHDPQTSGGLLLSVDPRLSPDILKVLKKQFQFSEIVGEVLPTEEFRVKFES